MGVLARTGLVLGFLAAGALRAESEVPTPGRLYTLGAASDFQEGCFYLCDCPIVLRNDLQGRFTLVPVGTEDGYDIFSVVDLEWTVGADLVGPSIAIQGSGTYRIDTSGQGQELVLDLMVGDRNVERYDSGLVPVTVPFPAIDIVVLTYPFGCYDTVMHIDAVPTAQGVRPPRLQFEEHEPQLETRTTWGRLKRFWAH